MTSLRPLYRFILTSLIALPAHAQQIPPMVSSAPTATAAPVSIQELVDDEETDKSYADDTIGDATLEALEALRENKEKPTLSTIPPLPPSTKGPFGDMRIKLMIYDENDVYTINTRYGFTTSIMLGPNESVQTISVGDRSLWQIIPSGNRLFIRPMDDGLYTNMTLITSQRSYQFDLKSLAKDDDSTIVYVAKFVYPDNKSPGRGGSPIAPVAAPAPAPVPTPPIVFNRPTLSGPQAGGINATPPTSAPEPAPKPEPAPVIAAPPAVEKPPITVTVTEPPKVSAISAAKHNYDYTFSGADTLAPLQVYDDGASTYVRYRDMQQPPPDAFTVDKTGNEQPARYTIRNDMMVIDGLSGEWRLKSKNGIISIYNEQLNPG